MDYLKKLKSYTALQSPNRSPAIDVYRGIAIITVLLFHYHGLLPLGHLGVDFFFVISGYLVGGILINYFKAGHIPFLKFIVARGLKIWLSYFFFLLLGNTFAYLFYRKFNTSYYIPLSDLKPYILFYRNYIGVPFHWCFDHLWSLCVEEHFYVLFPLALIIILKYTAIPTINYVYALCVIAIIMGFVFKLYMLYYTNGKDTYSATHNRIDALAYGVLLSLLVHNYKGAITPKISSISLLTGAMGMLVVVLLHYNYYSVFYAKIIVHSVVPLFFSLLILGSINFKFSNFWLVRFISYYSYNLYLWHPLVVVGTTQYFGTGLNGFLVYLSLSLLTGILATLLIEEPFLKLKNKLAILST